MKLFKYAIQYKYPLNCIKIKDTRSTLITKLFPIKMGDSDGKE